MDFFCKNQGEKYHRMNVEQLMYQQPSACPKLLCKILILHVNGRVFNI